MGSSMDAFGIHQPTVGHIIALFVRKGNRCTAFKMEPRLVDKGFRSGYNQE